MSERLLKTKRQKIAPAKPTEEEPKKVVLVGTYAGSQLTDWPGFYPYPISSDDKVDAESCAKVNEIWLFKGTKEPKYFAAEFVGIKTREELKALGYPAKGKGHGDGTYLLFKIEKTYAPASSSAALAAAVERVIVRTKDFARSPKVRKQLKAYLESTDRTDKELAAQLPSIITKLPAETLRVCEAAVQLDFLNALDSKAQFLELKTDFFKEIRDNPIAKILRLEKLSEATGFTHVDCFSGVGGFCTGMHAAGFTTLVAIEKIKSCVETYRKNHTEVHVINNDICKVGESDVVPYCPRDGVDLVTSGMPCETFSTAGNTSRSFYDERQFLFREGIRIAQMTKAKFLLFENVPAITTKTVSKHSSELIVDVLKEEMVKAGYENFIEVVLDSTKFGVPQRRKRYFVLGTRLKGIDLRKPTSRLSTCFTVKDAFADLPPVVPNTWEEGTAYNGKTNPFIQIMRDDAFWRREEYTTRGITYHMPMKHRPATLERFALIRPGEGLRDLFERYEGKEREALQARRILPKKMFIKRNCRLVPTEPSSTVTSHCLEEFVHPTENRALTVRECARLQSFPDSYDFAGGPYIVPHIDREVQDKYEQIGDAVPPLLAYAWGRVVAEMLKEVQ